MDIIKQNKTFNFITICFFQEVIWRVSFTLVNFLERGAITAQYPFVMRLM
jgi:hypothetical protein